MAKSKPTPPETGKPDPDAPAPSAGDPPEDEGKNKPAGKGYVCIEPVKHNGKDHAPGDPIELGEADAKPLLDLQAIRKA